MTFAQRASQTEARKPIAAAHAVHTRCLRKSESSDVGRRAASRETYAFIDADRMCIHKITVGRVGWSAHRRGSATMTQLPAWWQTTWRPGAPHSTDTQPVVTADNRLRFDGRSTAYQRSLGSQWRNPQSRWPNYLSRPQSSSAFVTYLAEWS